MTTDSTQVVLCITEEKHVIIRIRSISRISQPEVLPDHDAMTVAGLIETLVTNLSHPVANHRTVHILMITHGDIILTRAVQQIMLIESPVTT